MYLLLVVSAALEKSLSENIQYYTMSSCTVPSPLSNIFGDEKQSTTLGSSFKHILRFQSVFALKYIFLLGEKNFAVIQHYYEFINLGNYVCLYHSFP